MKKTRKHLPFYIFLLVLVWKSSSLVQAQSNTYTGDIYIRTQAHVNALDSTLAGKTIIDGDVTIWGSDITDLTPLSSLVRITGYFNVLDHYGYLRNGELTSLGDFPSLRSIGGNFHVSTYSVTDLGNFPVLKTIGGYFSVGSSKLTDLGNFPVLQTIDGYFEVDKNGVLFPLEVFQTLQVLEQEAHG